ncbi:Spectrin beta chain-like protein [Dinothrombium tinctorium]|uniref:Spectrin beta chain-like protein n=1 Tax=Dinothrombium tinctorium TaxID=1965070 RepID=A0A443R4L5_9ACAR|nr:Spectrin beta chain-like protein [Dinothrombium tinctorium]
MHQFLQDCEQLQEWIQEKYIFAPDEKYRSAKTIHSKWTRHQAFEAEIASNKDRLYDVKQEAENLIKQRPELRQCIKANYDYLTSIVCIPSLLCRFKAFSFKMFNRAASQANYKVLPIVFAASSATGASLAIIEDRTFPKFSDGGSKSWTQSGFKK